VTVIVTVTMRETFEIGVGQACVKETQIACAALTVAVCNATYPFIEDGDIEELRATLSTAMPNIMNDGAITMQRFRQTITGRQQKYMNVEDCIELMTANNLVWNDRRVLSSADNGLELGEISLASASLYGGFVASVTSRRFAHLFT
jgi:hypothetical protein